MVNKILKSAQKMKDFNSKQSSSFFFFIHSNNWSAWELYIIIVETEMDSCLLKHYTVMYCYLYHGIAIVADSEFI